MSILTRGEVWWIQFDGSQGGEIQKTRPVVIVSNNQSNKFLNRVQVVPLSTRVDKIYPSEALVIVKRRKHKALADQITTVSKKRFSNRQGKLDAFDMAKVEEIIRIQLALR